MIFLLLIIASMGALSVPAKAQSLPDPASFAGAIAGTTTAQPAQVYSPPTNAMKLHNYLFEAFGPYPILGAAIASSISHASNSPREWGQGAEGYGRRFGSDFGIAAVSTTTRFALSAVFKEDTLYYPCDCKGVLPRLKHALISTVTARRGQDGHRVFSFPALVAPYAGTMTAVSIWYPNRYNAMDAFRMGNYNMLGSVGGNIALEFLYSGSSSLLARLHLSKKREAPVPISSP